MLQQMIVDLFKIAPMTTVENNDKTYVYIHNFSGFDAIFLINLLAEFSPQGFHITKRDDKIISLEITKSWSTNPKNKRRTIIVFRDSLNMLPAYLASLGKGFGVEQKGSFDFNLVNECKDLNSIRDELLNYNKQDTALLLEERSLVLHEVLDKFQDLFFDLFQLDVAKSATLPSLAFKTYLSNFMSEDAKIPITDLALYDKLRSGYTGGAVDVFVPHTDSKVYCYDINSLYPSVMRDFDFPVGQPRFFEGQPTDFDNSFGFLRVRVKAPLDLNVPLLQVKHEGRTIAPIGTWIGWYFSEELKLAKTLGYKFEVIEGILFDKAPLFDSYVDTLYNMRKSYDKSDPRNMICKLLLNSLYGRFGMSPRLTSYGLWPADAKFKTLPSEIIELSEQRWLVGFDVAHNVNLTNTKKEPLEISLPIAIAVTAFRAAASRMRIYKYKQLTSDNLLYSDTDSIFTTKPLLRSSMRTAGR
jgi:hypothetical protein